jgi:formate hydrogenlyase subunit 6/NADH:ubiquinone oxidoreductase subunit I
MGHVGGKDIYRKLGRKIDNLTIKAPWNETFHAILKELYSPEEADIIVKMPYVLSDFDRLQKVTKCEKSQMGKILESLCSKGLAMDFWIRGKYYYMPSPIIIGIFEFTMMRTGKDVNSRGMAKLFHQYMDGSFFGASFGKNEKSSMMRTLPHEDVISSSEYAEILDYERATALIEEFDRFSIGLCSCRHERFHLNEKTCDVPLEKCSSFGRAADYMIRHNFAREVSKTEMLENLAHSKETGLVLNADNVKSNITYICHCCKCCCNALHGISKYGYANTIVTSSFIAENDPDTCIGCGKCAKACAIDAIEMTPIENPRTKKKKDAKIDSSICLGCGVCALQCKTEAVKLVKRGQRVIHPETTFERVILQCLDRGTLQYQIFDDPGSLTQTFMRGFLGGFLKLSPVKKALMSDMLRSRFLESMKRGVTTQGKGYVTEM